ncbi:Uncharacterized protein FWK35_00022531 [Aphis craccivora]|uniref:Uncharacterized protein n=1 Tax=Aphis craccivora TaxID=307492 RepID=A0A6G0Z6Z8_APHCR|nr:Uncharacterized protein FWK35_00022531 [Aphis craccivora]
MRMKINVLCAARRFVVKNRTHLILAIASTVFGYLVARYFDYPAVKTYSGTDLAKSTTTQQPIEFWHGIQTKIDEIAVDIHELQAYMVQQKFRLLNTAKK